MNRLAAVALLLPLVLVGCTDDGDDVARDTNAGEAPPADVPADDSTMPTTIPAAPGKVHSRSIGMVMDVGDGAELCLGAVAESYPPQCGGPAIPNWDWGNYEGTFEKQGEIRWGSYAVSGTWDGTEFTVTDAITAALYDPAMPEPTPLPEPSHEYTQADLDRIAVDLSSQLPGASSGYADQEGHALVDVFYDDGSLQQWADDEYGAGVVVLTSALVDA